MKLILIAAWLSSTNQGIDPKRNIYNEVSFEDSFT